MTYNIRSEVQCDDDVDHEEDGSGSILRVRLHHYIRIAEIIGAHAQTMSFCCYMFQISNLLGCGLCYEETDEGFGIRIEILEQHDTMKQHSRSLHILTSGSACANMRYPIGSIVL